MNNFFGCLFVLTLFSLYTLDGVDVQLMSTERDLLSKHLISVKLILNDNEKAVYKKSLQFSLDDADIVIMQWKSISEPITEYMQHMKRTELVFKETSYFEIGISEHPVLQKKIEDRLKPLNLFVSCIVLSQQGLAVARTIKVPLLLHGIRDVIELAPKTTAVSVINHDTPIPMLVAQEEIMTLGRMVLSFTELIAGYLDQLKDFLHKNMRLFLLGLLSVFVALGILFYCVRRRLLLRRVTGEFLLFLAMLGWNGMLFFVVSWPYAAIFFIAAGLCNGIVSWRYAWRSNHLPRLVQIGFVLAACSMAATVLPFFMQALLLLW